MKSLNVLLIEDSPEYAALVLRWLSGDPGTAEFSLIWTDSLGAALSRLEQGGIDLVLMDLGLPDSDGLQSVTSLWAKEPGLPVIVLSGADNQALALRTIQLGAQDYLVKSACTKEMLIRALRHGQARHEVTVPRAQAPANQARIVGVLGSAGGAGTTTVACVLAAELRHHTDQSTLLIDLDSNPGLVAFTLGIDPQLTVQDAIDKAEWLDHSLWEALITRRAGSLDILSSSRLIREGSLDLANLRHVLSFASRHYRWIVMDLGRLNHISAELLKGADDVILVTTESIPGLHQCKHAIEAIRDREISAERVRLILNQRHEGEQFSRKEIESLFGVPIHAILPPAHDDLYSAYLKKQLPRVTGEFRRSLSTVARKMAGLPEENPKRPLLSLTSLKDRIQQIAS